VRACRWADLLEVSAQGQAWGECPFTFLSICGHRSLIVRNRMGEGLLRLFRLDLWGPGQSVGFLGSRCFDSEKVVRSFLPSLGSWEGAVDVYSCWIGLGFPWAVVLSLFPCFSFLYYGRLPSVRHGKLMMMGCMIRWLGSGCLPQLFS